MNGIYDFPYVVLDDTYYQMFRSVRSRNVEMNRLLNDIGLAVTQELHAQFRGEGMKTLVLGSATPRNLRYIQHFLHRRLEVDLPKSSIYLIDRDDRSLAPHRAYAKRRARLPQVHVIGSNVIAHPIVPGTMDLILSDYTGSFMVEEETWDAFFREIGSSLAPGGVVLVNCFVCRYQVAKPLLYRTHNQWTRVCVSERKLHALIGAAGLRIHAVSYRTAVNTYEGYPANSTTYVLKRT